MSIHHLQYCGKLGPLSEARRTYSSEEEVSKDILYDDGENNNEWKKEVYYYFYIKETCLAYQEDL